MMILRRQRTVQRNDVRFSKQRLQIDIFRAQLQRLLTRVGIIRQQPHTKTFKNPHRRNPDFTGTDDTRGFVMHVETGQAVERKVCVTGTLISAMNTAIQSHHQADSMFSDRFR